MSKRTLSHWERSRKKNTTGRVGEFYTSLVRAIVGGKSVGWAENGSDLVNEELGFEVEVKAASNNRHFRISSAQRARYQESVPFPLDSFLYALCSYRGKGRNSARNGHKGRMQSRLSGRKTKSEMFQVLSERTDEVYLLDLEVVTAFEKALGVSAGHFAGEARSEEVFVMKRLEHIRPLWNGGQQDLLTLLGLDVGNWQFDRQRLERTLLVSGHSYVVKFDLLSMLRPNFRRRLFKDGRFSPTMTE